MTPEQLAVATVAVQVAATGIFTIFMWGINGKFADIRETLKNHRESLNKLFDNKQDKGVCDTLRQSCPGPRGA